MIDQAQMIREFDAAVQNRQAFRAAAGLPEAVTLPETMTGSLAFADDCDDLRIVDGVLYSGAEVWNALTRRGGV